MQDLTERLAQIHFLKGLPRPLLEEVAASGRMRRFPRGSTIFREGEPSAGVFVLLSGEVHLRKVAPHGREQIMALIRPVVMFNAVPALDNGPNPATAVAVEDCETWHVRLEAVRALMRSHPEVGLALLPVLASRLRLLVSQYEDLSCRPVLARTARLLLNLSDGGRQSIDRKHHSIYEMSARIATVPEAISRSLSVMKRDGLIDCNRRSITIRRPEVLVEMAQLDAATRLT